MKKIVLLLVILFALTSCNQSKEISTYKEIIEDGKVEIDGISYDIKSVSKTSYTYDDNENIIELVSTHDDSKMRTEYLYENNQLIEEKRYSYDELASTAYYYYEDDLLKKKKTVNKGGLEVRTEYSYGDNTETQTHYSSNGSISFSSKAYLDDDGKILRGIITDRDGEIMDTRTFHYDNDLLTKVIVEKDDVKFRTFNYEYNNLGDKIMEYNITLMEDDNLLIATFFDYEYNEDLLPKAVTVYRVQSTIAEEDIRDYQ